MLRSEAVVSISNLRNEQDRKEVREYACQNMLYSLANTAQLFLITLN